MNLHQLRQDAQKRKKQYDSDFANLNYNDMKFMDFCKTRTFSSRHSREILEFIRKKLY